MKNIRKMSNEELIEYLKELNEKDDLTLDEIGLYTKILKLMKENLLSGYRKDKQIVNNQILDKNLRNQEEISHIDRATLNEAAKIIQKYIQDGTYNIYDLGTYKNSYTENDSDKFINLYVEYDSNNPFYFKEVITGGEIPISFDAKVMPDDKSDLKELCDYLKLPYNDVSKVGGTEPDFMSVRVKLDSNRQYMGLEDGLNIDKFKTNGLHNYLKSSDDYINGVLTDAYNLGLELKKKELAKKKTK